MLFVNVVPTPLYSRVMAFFLLGDPPGAASDYIVHHTAPPHTLVDKKGDERTVKDDRRAEGWSWMRRDEHSRDHMLERARGR